MNHEMVYLNANACDANQVGAPLELLYGYIDG